MNKRILFFDGDGTLWYPSATGRAIKPWWIYNNSATKENYLDHLILDPLAVPTLTRLGELGIKLFILSTVPDSKHDPQAILRSKIERLGIEDLVDGYYATREIPEAKGLKILELVERYALEAQDALMVGDSPNWDYKSAKDAGIDALLIKCGYHREEEIALCETIDQLCDLLDIHTRQQLEDLL